MFIRSIVRVTFAALLAWAALGIPAVRVAVAQEQAQGAAQPLTLNVDATDAPRRMFRSQMTIPVSPGALTLYYPQWIPGEHGPTGPIMNLTDLKFSAAGKAVPWRRDLKDMYAFHLDVPPGATFLEVNLDWLSPVDSGQFSSGPSATSQLAVVDWHNMLLYPKGKPAAAIAVRASVKLPPHWGFGTALVSDRNFRPVKGENMARFEPVSLVTLIDSPLVTGLNYKQVELTPGQTPAHFIDIVADSAAGAAIPAERVGVYKNLVAQTLELFGSTHYTQYHFLVTCSDILPANGLEHHESSDNRDAERFLIDDTIHRLEGDLLPHEFFHSWNGKCRRPVGLATADFQEPYETDLLWVYEGLTQYYGKVLSARSGIWTPEDFRENLAYLAAQLDAKSGRAWRSLQDTSDTAQLLYNAPSDWANIRRGCDFYDEGVLIWLEVDTIIREKTSGAKSLDDFCRVFHSQRVGSSGRVELKPYTLDDVVAALNEVCPNDWKTLLVERENSVSPHAPLAGIVNSGWKLEYTERPNDFMSGGSRPSLASAAFSLGLRMKDDGTITDAAPGWPGMSGGLAPGMKIIAINGRKFTPDRFADLIRDSKDSKEALEIMVESTDYITTHHVEYHHGERYPHLVRDEARADVLTQIVSPLAVTGH